jgi:hypothetical protein
VLHVIVLLSGRDETLMIYMGHGMEIVIAAIFLYRELSQVAVHHQAERFLYAFLAFFVVTCNVVFCWRLLYDRDFQARYAEGKGGFDNDFYRLAYEKLPALSQNSIIAFHLAVTLLVPAAVAAYFFWSRRAPRKKSATAPSHRPNMR